MKERSDYDARFVLFDRESIEKFDHLADTVKAKIDGYVESLK